MNSCVKKEELNILKQKYDRLTELLTYEEVLLDKKLFLNLEKQQHALCSVVSKYAEYLKLENHISELDEIINNLQKDEIA